MNVLLLAPQPFYQERGTPIAVDRLLQALSERHDHVDAVVYHEGQDRQYARVTLYRASGLPGVHNIGPGFSWKKLLCDLLMLLRVVQLLAAKKYQVVHAVEEAVFLALLIRLFLRIPYVYDMDSSLSEQLADAHPIVAPFAWLFRLAERVAVRNALVILPVCEELARMVKAEGGARVVVLPDPSLLEDGTPAQAEDLRATRQIRGPIVMYVGSLKAYQGIDLLLQSFALALEKVGSADLVVIGGEPREVEAYQARSGELGIRSYVHFLGARALPSLGAYLAQADVLVSPRIRGHNTPMKLYSYLDSGKAVLATNLPTHTQLLNGQVAVLAPPHAPLFGAALARLIQDEPLRHRLGLAGRALVRERYSYAEFRRKVHALYDSLSGEAASLVGSGLPEAVGDRPS